MDHATASAATVTIEECDGPDAVVVGRAVVALLKRRHGAFSVWIRQGLLDGVTEVRVESAEGEQWEYAFLGLDVPSAPGPLAEVGSPGP